MVWRISKSNMTQDAVTLGRLAGLACVLILPCTAPVSAFDETPRAPRGAEREAVLGTFHIRDEARDLDHTARAPALLPKLKHSELADIMHTFADARAARDDGDLDEAQRLFERVIAAHPNSRLADEARKDLGELYRRQKDLAPKTRAARITPDRPVETYGPRRPERRDTRSRDRQDTPDVKRSRRLVMLERQFIADVGDRIFFAKGSHELGARARDVLNAQAEWLKAHPDIVVSIEGHADDGASGEGVDFDLSDARADVVRARLIEEGVHEDRLRTKSFGEGRPVAQCSNPGCSAQNRRVVTVIGAGARRAGGDLRRLGQNDHRDRLPPAQSSDLRAAPVFP